MRIYFKNGTSTEVTQEEANIIVKHMSEAFEKNQLCTETFADAQRNVLKLIVCAEITHIA